jgi:Tol biopolymer transport system component/DNA-binding winged helix-turn-helix (wHTH) protein
MGDSMATSNSFPVRARFDQFHVDFSSGVLQRSGVRVPVQSQPLQVLRLLLAAEGKVVTREELRKVLWPEDTFVDFELGVNTAVKKLRQALTDPADHPKFIETLPRIGHRFMVPVEWVTEDSQKGTLAESVTPGGGALASARERTTIGLHSVGNLRWMAVGCTILVALCGIAVWGFIRSRTALPPIEVVPLVGLPGMENDPAFSPDGNQVAFAIRNPAHSGIYTTVVGGEKSLRLTTHPGDGNPRWSPDGRQLAFIRHSEEGVAIYVIPALGGTEHRLYSSPAGINTRSLDWSPDGKVLAITAIDADRIHTWIALLSLEDSTTQRLTSPADQEQDCSPAFSPDGGTVAFVRGITPGVVSDVYVVPSSGGEPRRLTHDNTWIMGAPAWTPDGRDIVFSSMRAGLASLWRVSASGSTPPRPLVGVGLNASGPSVSRKGNQLVYQQTDFKNNVWRLNMSDEKTRRGPPSIVISDKGPSLARPHFSPDGKRIAFESDRLGYANLWTCDSDGSNCSQLTSLHGTSGAATWSPDGRQIAFEFRPKQHSEVYVAEVGGGPPRLLETFSGSDNGGPNWSRDGKWIYFYSNHGGSLQIWKMQLNGGSPVQVTTKGGVVGAESSDGRFLYFAKLNVPGLWKMPLHGGEETRIFDQPFVPFSWWDWGLTEKGIYFINFQTSPTATVAFFEFATNKIFPIWALADRPFVGLSVSADGKSILYVQNEYSQSDIMLVKNFR